MNLKIMTTKTSCGGSKLSTTSWPSRNDHPVVIWLSRVPIQGSKSEQVYVINSVDEHLKTGVFSTVEDDILILCCYFA